MYRLSLIIGEIYNQFLPRTEKGKISLNLDFSDTTKEISDPEEIRYTLEQALDSAFQRTNRGNINMTVNNSEIIITDQGTILSKTACTLLSHGRVRVKSRVGFGTSVHISITTPPEDNASKTETKAQTSPKIKTSPTVKTQNSTEAKASKNLTPASKQMISNAAKRADKKVHKIAQKRLKQASTKKKPKVIHKIDFS